MDNQDLKEMRRILKNAKARVATFERNQAAMASLYQDFLEALKRRGDGPEAKLLAGRKLRNYLKNQDKLKADCLALQELILVADRFSGLGRK